MTWPLLSVLWSCAALGADYQVDLSTLATGVGAWPILLQTPCEAPNGTEPRLHGQPLRTQGVAVVVYSRKQGTMAWGHASLRALYCLNGEVVDVEYEAYRLDAANEPEVRRSFPEDAFAQDEGYLRAQRGALFLFRNEGPADAGYFGEAQAHNRELYELWLDLSPQELDQIVLGAEARVDEQLTRARARADLQGRYRPLSTNCTTLLQELLPVSYGAFPFAWLRGLEDQARLRVMYPSHHMLRRWGAEPPERTARPHPVLRRGGRPAPEFPGQRPVVLRGLTPTS